MDFKAIKKDARNVVFDSLRMDCDNYFEGVVLKDEMSRLVKSLESHFGSPAWPSNNRLSLQVQEQIRDYGGVAGGQTLYYQTAQGEAIFAMLWPWKDGQRTTVKIVKK